MFKYLRFKSFDRLIKCEKGKLTGRISLIQKRHSSSKCLSLDSISVVNTISWEVQSENGCKKYIVEKISDDCSDHCALNCKECNICVHTYNCTCPDSQIYHTICKHVHLVVQYNHNPQSKHQDATAIPVKKLDYCLQTTLVNEISVAPKIPLDSLKNRILLLIQDITNQVELSSSVEKLKGAEKLLFAAKNNLSACVTSINAAEPVRNEPANKKIEKQRPFQKIKKKNKSRVRYGYPSRNKRDKIEILLLGSQAEDQSISIVGKYISKAIAYNIVHGTYVYYIYMH